MNTNPSQTLQKNQRGGNISKITLQDQHYMTPKSKKKILQENYRPISLININTKKFPQNTSKPNSIAHYKDCTPW